MPFPSDRQIRKGVSRVTGLEKNAGFGSGLFASAAQRGRHIVRAAANAKPPADPVTFKNIIGAHLLGLGAVAATTGASVGAHAAYEGVKKRKLMGSGFQNMLDENPDLKKEDIKNVKAMYSLLVDTSPSLAGNPILAGNWVRSRTALEGRIEPADIQQLVNTEKAIRERSTSDRIFGALEQGSKSTPRFKIEHIFPPEVK